MDGDGMEGCWLESEVCIRQDLQVVGYNSSEHFLRSAWEHWAYTHENKSFEVFWAKS